LNTWLISGSSDRLEYDEFVSRFGIDDTLIVSWEGCDLDDPRLPKLEKHLNDVAVNDGLVAEAVSGTSVFDRLIKAGISKKQAIARIRGTFVGRDSKSTCLIVRLSDKGHSNRKLTVRRIEQLATEATGLKSSDLKWNGSAYVIVQIDQSTAEAPWVAAPGCIAGFLLACLFIRRLTVALSIAYVGGLAALSSIGALKMAGVQFNGLLVLMPIILFVLTVSGSIHICSYVKDEFSKKPWRVAIFRARKQAWTPCTFSFLTTAVALLSLAVSRIEAVKIFGLTTAFGMVMAWAFVMFVLPSLLVLIGPGKTSQTSNSANNSKCLNYFLRLLQFPSLRYPVLLFSAGCVVLAVFSFSRMTSVMRPTSMFPEDSAVAKNADWFEENLFGLGNFECIIRFDELESELVAGVLSGNLPQESDIVESEMSSLETQSKLDLIWEIQKRLTKHPKVEAGFSVINLYGPLPAQKRIRDFVKRTAVARQVLQDREQLIEQRLTSKVGDSWRIRLQTESLAPGEYKEFKNELTNIASSLPSVHERNVHVSFTGMTYLSAYSQQNLFDELAKSFALAVLMITPIVMLQVRGFWAGLLAMIPNVAPTLLVFGLLNWSGQPISIGTILTATVGLGIAIDDTLHFLHWFRVYSLESEGLIESTRRTVAKCWRPILQTSMICSAGLLFFCLSDFVPIQQFGSTIACMLILAVVFDLLVLPSMILSPVGRLFKNKVTAG